MARGIATRALAGGHDVLFVLGWCVRSANDDEHGRTRRVPREYAVLALLDRGADRREARAHGDELVRARDDERPMPQADRVRRNGRDAASAPEVEADVVVVAAGGDEDRAPEVGHHREAEAVAVEAGRGLEVADVQVHVADGEAGGGVPGGVLARDRREQGVEVERRGTAAVPLR